MQSILFLSVMNGSAWGGSEEQWYRFAIWLADRNHSVGVAVMDWEEKSEKLNVLKKKGCEIYLIPGQGSGLFRMLRQKNVLNKIPFKKYELVYVNQGGWKDVAHGPFKHLYKKLPAYALSFHNYERNAKLDAGKVKILRAWIENSKVCIAATAEVFNILAQEYSIFVSNKEVSYSPPTFSVPASLTAYPPTGESLPWVFLALGALDTVRKAQDVLIRVLGRSEWKNRNWRLNIYGEGKDRKMLEDLVSELGLNEKVFLPGHTTDPKKFITDCHLLIQATRFDAMPISVIEAMALARPCLVTDVGDMSQWVKDDVNGFVVDKINEEELHKKMDHAWQVKTEWEMMGGKAFETFQSKYPSPYEEKFLGLLNNYYKKGK